MATPMLRRWGFRAVLRGSACGLMATIAAMAFVTPQTPTWLLIAVITASGAVRSVGFTRLNTIAYAGVAPSELLIASGRLGADVGANENESIVNSQLLTAAEPGVTLRWEVVRA